MADFAAAVRAGLEVQPAALGDGTRDGAIRAVLAKVGEDWRRAFGWRAILWADGSDDDPNRFYIYVRKPWTIWNHLYLGKIDFNADGECGGYVWGRSSDVYHRIAFVYLSELPDVLAKMFSQRSVAAGLVRLFGAVPREDDCHG